MPTDDSIARTSANKSNKPTRCVIWSAWLSARSVSSKGPVAEPPVHRLPCRELVWEQARLLLPGVQIRKKSVRHIISIIRHDFADRTCAAMNIESDNVSYVMFNRSFSPGLRSDGSPASGA